MSGKRKVDRPETKEQLSVSINSMLLARLKTYAKEVGRTVSDVVDRACEFYLESRSLDDGDDKPKKPGK